MKAANVAKRRAAWEARLVTVARLRKKLQLKLRGIEVEGANGNSAGGSEIPPPPQGQLVSHSPQVHTKKRTIQSHLHGLVPLYPYQRRWLEDKARYRIVVKGRQVGYSFNISLEGALVARSTRRNQIYLSRGERQSKILAEKATNVVKALDIATSPIRESEWVDDSNSKIKCLQLEIQFPNGNKMYFLPAKPETARSYSGDVYLDEFAFHGDAQKIYAALYPTLTRGYRISVVSTPNGQIGKYYDFAREAGLVPGYERSPNSPWSPHRTDVYQATMEGLAEHHVPDEGMNIHPEIIEEIREGFRFRGFMPTPLQLRFVCELRAGADDQDTWQQEFECSFLSASKNYIPMELILAAENDNIASERLPDTPMEGRVFLGVDIGRKVNRTIIWVLEEVEDLLITRGVTVLSKALFPDQYKVIAEYMQELGVYKACIDSTGMGMQTAEQLEHDFPGRVEPVHFTLQSKDILATLMKRRFEEHRYRIPASAIIRSDINGIKRGVTKAGNIVFSAEDTKDGHSDRAWALALATMASDQPVAAPLTANNFIGIGRGIGSLTHIPDVPRWESRDMTSLWGGVNRITTSAIPLSPMRRF